MHELGIIDHVIREIENVAEQNQVRKVTGVKLEFGEVSGIVPEYLERAWNWMAKRGEHPLLEESEFEWDIIPAVTFCEDCKGTYETVKYGKTCPLCKSNRTWLLQGNGINIKEITVNE